MAYEVIDEATARQDALNWDATGMVTPLLLEQAHDEWYDLSGDPEEGILGPVKLLAGMACDGLARAIVDARLAMQAVGGATTMEQASINALRASANARFALWCCVDRALSASSLRFDDASSRMDSADIEVTPCIDHAELRNGAYGIIIGRTMLQNALGLDLEPQGNQWFRGSEDGLYLCVTKPEPSDSLKRDLSKALGDPERVDQYLDVEHSLELRAYASRRFVLANS